MATIEALKRRIDSTRKLKSVVCTMKSLAAVNIRQYEGAAASLSDYTRTVEMGLQAVLMNRPGARVLVRKAPLERVGAVVFGSDQGMCGPLNEGIVRHARETLAAWMSRPMHAGCWWWGSGQTVSSNRRNTAAKNRFRSPAPCPGSGPPSRT